ncbi:MAG: hypothetical protein R3D63_16300 [Paracoccaceae bacterium]
MSIRLVLILRVLLLAVISAGQPLMVQAAPAADLHQGHQMHMAGAAAPQPAADDGAAERCKLHCLSAQAILPVVLHDPDPVAGRWHLWAVADVAGPSQPLEPPGRVPKRG